MRSALYLSRAWAQVSSAASMSGASTGGAAVRANGDTCTGRGRTLGGTPGARPPWASTGGDGGAERPVPAEVVVGGSSPAPSFNAARVPLPAATPAGPAAAGSSDARARAARAAEARALGLASGAGHEPPTAGAVAAAAAGLLPTGNARSEAPPPGLRQLVEMEFREDAAASAGCAALCGAARSPLLRRLLRNAFAASFFQAHRTVCAAAENAQQSCGLRLA